MQLRTQITLILGLSVAVWTAYLYFTGQTLTPSLFAPFGVTGTVVSLAAVLFVRFVWRWEPLRGWLVERPFLGGTWRATLRSTYKVDGKPVEKTVFVVIRQTLTSLSFRLYTDTAKSASIAENICRDGTDLFRLAVAYQNTPDVEHRGQDSEIHYGSALFSHIDFGAERVEGHYWTDRNTSGSLVLEERKSSVVSSYEAARALFAPTSNLR